MTALRAVILSRAKDLLFILTPYPHDVIPIPPWRERDLLLPACLRARLGLTALRAVILSGAKDLLFILTLALRSLGIGGAGFCPLPACLRAQRGICFISLLLTFHSPLVTVVSAQGITPQSIITTVAGGSWQFRGDGGPAIDAPLGTIQGVAVDSAGNVYVADPDNFLILKISPDGILTIVAGNGLLGFSGDGGPATSASLPVPVGVALDAAGSLYIATLRRIHKVSADGIITTVAGNGEDGFSGDGGPATSATFDTISGVAVDTSGNLYIADSHNQRIRKVGLDGIITTVAGSGDTGYFNGGFSGDNGPATSALLSQPADVAVDAAGNLYIADEQNDRIRKVGLDGIITTVVGGAFPAMAFRPQVLLLIDPAGWR